MHSLEKHAQGYGEFVDYIPESLAIKMIIIPESSIEGFQSSSEPMVDTWERKFRRRSADILGRQEIDGQFYGVEIAILAPGFLGREISRLRGKEPWVVAYTSTSNKPIIDSYDS